MADNTTKRGSTDRKRLNMSEPYEVAYAKSSRASPERKAMLAKAEAARSARSAKGTTSSKKSGAGKSGGKSGSGKSAGATKSSSTRSGSAKKSSARNSSAKGSAAEKAPARSGSTKSRSGAAKRSSASTTRGAPTRKAAAPSRARQRTPTTRTTPHPPSGEKTAKNTAPKTMREADAVDLLTDDHLAVSALFEQYDKLAKKKSPAAQRRTVAQRICEMLKAHTEIEEEIFYPAARKAGIDGDKLDEAKVEHASAKGLIAEIEGANPEDDFYDAKVTVLGEYVQHHVVEEQTEMFPKCRRTGMDLVALRGELEARKRSILGDDGASAAGDAAGRGDASRGDGKNSPGLLAKLGDKLFSSADESAAEARGPR